MSFYLFKPSRKLFISLRHELACSAHLLNSKTSGLVNLKDVGVIRASAFCVTLIYDLTYLSLSINLSLGSPSDVLQL